jgi:hypothetical protein
MRLLWHAASTRMWSSSTHMSSQQQHTSYVLTGVATPPQVDADIYPPATITSAASTLTSTYTPPHQPQYLDTIKPLSPSLFPSPSPHTHTHKHTHTYIHTHVCRVAVVGLGTPVKCLVHTSCVRERQEGGVLGGGGGRGTCSARALPSSGVTLRCAAKSCREGE